VTPSIRHVVAIDTLAGTSVRVSKLVQATAPANAAAAINCQEFGSAHSAHICVETLLTACKGRTAQLALAIIEVIPGFTLPAACFIVTVTGDAPLDRTSRTATSTNEHVVLTLGAALASAVNTQRVFDSAVQTLVINRVEPSVALIARSTVVTLPAQGVNQGPALLAYGVLIEVVSDAAFTLEPIDSDQYSG
jgi:hypothetical protein